MKAFGLKQRKKNGCLFFCLLIPIVFLSLLQTGASVSEQIDGVRVEVDFARPVKVNSMSGFLHSVGRSEPAEKMIAPLAPRQWRTADGDPLVYERIKKSGARAQIVLSDFWGYPGLNTDRKWAFEAGGEFEDFVRELARRHPSKEIMWDIWNEPDDPRLPYWKGTFRQFCETYLRAYRVLREELGPQAMIGGPSFSRYDKTRLKSFLDFCLERGCEVNFLSWHELDDRKITGIADRLKEARLMFVENPVYKTLNIREIQINEIVGSRAQHDPAAISGYFYYLERGKADGAAKACWENSAGDLNCYNDSLDGILTRDGQPTAAWWAYKLYADGVGSRVAAETSNPLVATLASSRSETSESAQVIVGFFNQSKNAGIKTKITFEMKNLSALSFLPRNENVRIEIRKLECSGERAVDSLRLISYQDVKISNGNLSLVLNDVVQGEVYLILIGKPAGLPASEGN